MALRGSVEQVGGATSELEADLRAAVEGEVRFDAGSRSAYATDSSNFRQVPIGVVVPRSIEAGVAALAVCRSHEAPVLSRGGGTSLAGQCTNTAVVVDWSKYCGSLLSVEPERRTCVVEPGIVLDDLNDALRPTGLRFGPEPATHRNCTLGGMIGNNSCGATAQRTGKTVDNIARLEVLLYDGTRFWCGETSDTAYREIERHGDRRATLYRNLRRIMDEFGDDIRREFPKIPRRVSGYNVDSLLPEYGFDVAGLIVGSESTLATVLRAELELVPVIPAHELVVLAWDDIADAADHVPPLVEHEPTRLEGFDHKLVLDNELAGLNVDVLGKLPHGRAWLMVEFGGDSAAEAHDMAAKALRAVGLSPDDNRVRVVTGHDAEMLWRVRESALAATARVPGHRDNLPGWEDSAVAPDRLGDYLRDLERLWDRFGYADRTGPSAYGHFGQGCIHARTPFDLTSSDGVRTYRQFMEAAADLVVSYGGSLSGEHGDGQSRGELLPRMYGPRVMEAFARVKAAFDPQDRMSPGKLVRPLPLDADLRLGADWGPRDPGRLGFAYPKDDDSFTRVATRCVGFGKCRQHEPRGGVMCPSYQVTSEEEHSTRGRARLIFEMLDGHADGSIRDGWRSTAVRDALDLCLACKGCRSDCPAGVDMATYKAEFLWHHYRHRLRPRSDYTLGWLPVMAYVVSGLHLARPLRVLTRPRPLSRLATRLAGVADRELPAFAPMTLQEAWARHDRAHGDDRPRGRRGTVLVWPDTFTNHFAPHIGRAAVEVLDAAGWDVTLPSQPVCCGLTWISTGQLGMAKRMLRRTARTLAPHLRAGGLVVGLEPSCTAVFRSDAPDLLPQDADVARLRDQTVTLAELLHEHTPGWQPPRLEPDRRVPALAQVHCHQHAVLGWDAEAAVLDGMGVDLETMDSGCCGLAGNFGFEPGHADVSRAIAEQALLPTLARSGPETLVLADGFSCRTQIHELDRGGHRAHHLAEVLAEALPH
ncbi:MAG: FAD-binding and (Fe-S)-binding domain-containing protein [Intrasporangium sp.]|uniref:FAD-binding and (Fe-S)-binding domain-containing protein n=1 Tax=Intrasporangium sp. TaxID=1925024 RepID=UPI003F7EFF81